MARGQGEAEALASWRDGPAKWAILGLVRSASVPGPGFVQPRAASPPSPMLEFLGLLHAHYLRVFIATACEENFVGAVSEKLYGVPRESVIGSAPKLGQRGGRLVRMGEAKPINDGPVKAESIWERIGRTPLLAVGNADGDVPMLETARHAVLLRHDDAKREFAYEDTAPENAVRSEEAWLDRGEHARRLRHGVRFRLTSRSGHPLGARGGP